MSCGGDKCKCMFPMYRIWSAIKFPERYLNYFNLISISFNGSLLTPSFALGKKARGDYDLVEGFLIFNRDGVSEGDKVSIYYCGILKAVYIRKENYWKEAYSV